MIFDHVGYDVSDFARSKAFYLQALAPLGIGVAAEGEGWAMLGRPGKPQLRIGAFGTAPTATTSRRCAMHPSSRR